MGRKLAKNRLVFLYRLYLYEMVRSNFEAMDSHRECKVINKIKQKGQKLRFWITFTSGILKSFKIFKLSTYIFSCFNKIVFKKYLSWFDKFLRELQKMIVYKVSFRNPVVFFLYDTFLSRTLFKIIWYRKEDYSRRKSKILKCLS